MIKMKKSYLIVFLSLFLSGLFAQDGDLNMKIIAHVPSSTGGSGIWHFVDRNGIEYAALGTGNALVIYSLEDPAKPIERARINGVSTIWRELYIYKDHIYGVTDSKSDGIIIVDMSKAPTNITSKFWTTTVTAGGKTADLTTCHTDFVDENGILSLNGCQPWQGVLFFDLNQDPENPKFIGSELTRYAHDCYMRGDTLWTSDIYEGLLSIWNVKDKMNPIELATVRTPFAFTHNAWISDDAKYAFTTDEKANAYVAAYDVSDLNNIKLLDEWRPKDTEGTGVIPHNTRYLNGYLITAFYTDGIKIIDAHRPENLIEVGSVDTYFGTQTGFHGCWGVSPYLPSGTIVASDIEGGLFVIRPDYIRACYLEGNVRDSLSNDPISNVTVTINTPRLNFEATDLKGDYKTGYATAGLYDVEFRNPDYIPVNMKVDLQNGVLLTQNVKMLRIQSVTQRVVVKDKKTLQTIEGAHVVFQNTTRNVSGVTGADGSAAVLITQDLDLYDLIVGKWGYLHHAEIYNSLAPSSEIVVLVDRGYQDDFIFDLGWTTQGNATTGQWVRDIPVGTVYNGSPFQTAQDVTGDYGDACYITGNGAVEPADNDVDNGSVILTSPEMNLSTYNEPLINYSYWFANAGGNNTPNDKISFKLVSGTDTFLIKQLNQNDPAWRRETAFRVKSLPIKNLSSVYFITETADDAPGHLVEAALDAFLVVEGSPVSTNDKESELNISIYPTLFSNSTNLYLSNIAVEELSLSITDANGKIVEQFLLNNQGSVFNFGKDLKPGIYIAGIHSKNELIKSIRLVKI
jgi:choice-of-anchor B domain-containing protein